jgi:hypothetical protein
MISGSTYRLVRSGSIFMILLIVIGLDLCFHSNQLSTISKGHSEQEQTILKDANSSGLNVSGISILTVWIQNKDNFRLLSFSVHNFLQNRITDQIIALTTAVRLKHFILYNPAGLQKVLPHEGDEIPIQG